MCNHRVRYNCKKLKDCFKNFYWDPTKHRYIREFAISVIVPKDLLYDIGISDY